MVLIYGVYYFFLKYVSIKMNNELKKNILVNLCFRVNIVDEGSKSGS